MEPKNEVPIKVTAQEIMPALEAVWSDNAEGLPEADVVIIRAGESANRRFYPKEALGEAVKSGFWDDTPMFVDHGDKAAPRRRSARDFVATVLPGTVYQGSEGEVRGRIRFADTDFAKKVRNAAGTKALGLSAVTEFLGQRFRGNDGHMHERVHKLVVNHSLDFVAFPAAGGGIEKFIPAMESEGEVDWSRLTDSDWEQLPKDILSEKRPDLFSAAESDDDPDDDDKKKQDDDPTQRPDAGKPMIALEAVQTYINEQIDVAMQARDERERKQTETRTKVRDLVARSGLKPLAQADILTRFDGQESFDENAVQAAIDHEAKKIREAGLAGPVVKGMGESTAQITDDSAAKDDKPWVAFESQFDYTPLSGKKGASEDAGKVN